MMIGSKFGCDCQLEFRRVKRGDRAMLEKFKCEEGGVADFIHYESFDSKDDVTYVFLDKNENRIVCVCAIRCTGIPVKDANSAVFNGSSISAIEIDFFAVDEDYRSMPFSYESKRYETLSQYLLLYMVDYIENIANTVVAAEKICLYSVPEAVNFYKRCDFTDYSGFMISDGKDYVRDCFPMFRNIGSQSSV